MRLRSIDQLDLDVAWRRVLQAIRSETLADRLPYELVNRLYNAGERDALYQGPEYSPHSPVVYFAPKESRTLRPLVSLAPRDYLIYQALVDQATAQLQAVLPPEDVVYAYRPSAGTDDRPIQNRAWSDFQDRARIGLEGDYTHILETDLSGFFLHIRTHTIVKRLLAIGVDETICSDLEDLLGHFAVDGVQGLPQGLAPSSALSNLALLPLDRSMESSRAEYFRWSDDLRFLARSFSEGYAAQERIERLLYGEGFSIGGGKTYIRRATTALGRMRNLQESLGQIKDAKLRGALEMTGPYNELSLPDLEAEANVAAGEDFYNDLIQPIREGKWSRDPLFRTKLRFILRILGDVPSGIAIEDALQLLYRYPDEVQAVCRYLQRLTGPSADAVRRVIGQIATRKGMYLGEYVRFGLAIAAGPLAESGPSAELASLFAGFARDTRSSTLLRRRACTSAIALSPTGSEIAEELWSVFQKVPDPEISRLYLVAGASSHPERDSYYGVWEGESRLLTAAMRYLATNPLDLSRI